MSVFDQIKTGLEEAIDYERGSLKARVTKLSVEPVAHYDPAEIKLIRKNTGFT